MKFSYVKVSKNINIPKNESNEYLMDMEFINFNQYWLMDRRKILKMYDVSLSSENDWNINIFEKNRQHLGRKIIHCLISLVYFMNDSTSEQLGNIQRRSMIHYYTIHFSSITPTIKIKEHSLKVNDLMDYQKIFSY